MIPRVDWQDLVLYGALTALHVAAFSLPVVLFWWWL